MNTVTGRKAASAVDSAPNAVGEGSRGESVLLEEGSFLPVDGGARCRSAMITGSWAAS